MREASSLIAVAGPDALRFLRGGTNGNGHTRPADLSIPTAPVVNLYTDSLVIHENKSLAAADERWVARSASVLLDAIKALVETNRRKQAASLYAVLSDHVSFYRKEVCAGRAHAIETTLKTAQGVLNAPKSCAPPDQATRFRIFTRDNFRCQYCGCGPNDATLTIDHRVPKSKGGTRDDENLITACKKCNNGKGDADAPDLTPQASSLKPNQGGA